MSTSIEIEVESEEKCPHCGKGMKEEAKPSKDAMLAELKGLLTDTRENGRAERQMKIDELISSINELGED